MGIAPFVVLIGGERDAVVQHGGDHVDEGHLRDNAAVIAGAQIGNRAHEQSAGAAAHAKHLVLGGISGGDQMMRDVDEVGE